MTETEWHLIEAFTYRLKVFGGWIVRHNREDVSSMVFIPDVNHEWKI